ncbi:MAG TPA: hypothetical protein VMM15_16965 [Bradyrhizobium sp.]|nr:hypothetical protein [Bradyrhizobium sp.]
MLIANDVPAPVRKPSKPPSTEPFHVAVDRQLKSGHDTFEDAEQAALKIKNRYPHLHVTVFDAKEGRHKLIERTKAHGVPNTNRITERNAAARGKTVLAGRKH